MKADGAAASELTASGCCRIEPGAVKPVGSPRFELQAECRLLRFEVPGEIPNHGQGLLLGQERAVLEAFFAGTGISTQILWGCRV